MEKILKIEGMMCNHCVTHIQKSLAAVHGVYEVSVSLEDKSARIKLNQYVWTILSKRLFRMQVVN